MITVEQVRELQEKYNTEIETNEERLEELEDEIEVLKEKNANLNAKWSALNDLLKLVVEEEPKEEADTVETLY